MVGVLVIGLNFFIIDLILYFYDVIVNYECIIKLLKWFNRVIWVVKLINVVRCCKGERMYI